MSAILNVVPDGAAITGLPPSASLVVILAKTQFSDQVKISSTSQLISGMFKVLQKLLKCFGGITTSAFVNESLFSGVFPVIFALYLKDSGSGEKSSLLGSSL